MDNILEILKRIKVKHPELRYGQIIASSTCKTNPCNCTYVISDTDLTNRLLEFENKLDEIRRSLKELK